MFDHPTLRAIMALVQQQIAPLAADTTLAADESRVLLAAETKGFGVAARGLACRFPGGDGLEDGAWSHWLQRQDAVVEVPYLRWDLAEFFDADPEAIGNVTYSRHGGFVDGVELFDPQFFGMSAAEAKTIDPQQRYALEAGGMCRPC